MTSAWTKYAASLSTGEILELEADYESWVARALETAVSIRPTDPDEVDA